MRRVALISQGFPGGGGVATMVSFLYQVLSRTTQYRPEVISVATSHSDSASVRAFAPASWARGIQVEHRQHQAIPYRHAGAFLTELEWQRYRPRAVLSGLLREYDLLQFVGGSAALAYLARHIDRPVVIWTATTLMNDRASRLRSLPWPKQILHSVVARHCEQYESRMLEQADFILALSRYTYESIQHRITHRRLALAPCGVDTDFFVPVPRRLPPSHGVDVPYILCVGRLSDRRKNVSLLLRAYAQARRQLADAPTLLLVGSPPSCAGLQEIHSLGLYDAVKVLGPRFGEDLVGLYQHADFLVLPSDEEGLGIVVLEAMACGLPVIATRCGGPEMAVVHGETGILVDVGDEKQMAEAMVALVRGPAVRAEMGRRARQRAVSTFPIGATQRIFLRAYARLLDGRSSTRTAGHSLESPPST